MLFSRQWTPNQPGPIVAAWLADAGKPLQSRGKLDSQPGAHYFPGQFWRVRRGYLRGLVRLKSPWFKAEFKETEMDKM
jgi:hypothetical protein